jgi:hypothetical protein
MFRFLWIAVVASGLMAGSDKPAPSGLAAGKSVTVNATLYMTRQEATEALGLDPGEGIMIVRVTLKPLGDNSVNISLDDFTLHCYGEGQKSQPLYPTQIAGNAAMVLQSTPGQSVGIGPGTPKTTVSIPGINRQPAQAPPKAAGVKPPGGDAAPATVEAKDAKESPLLTALRGKILPEKEIKEPITGLLYFPFDGKHKVKELELIYKVNGERLDVKFKTPK